MAENKSLMAAVFAAGVAAGGGGTGVVQQQEIDAANQRADAAVAIVAQLDTHMPTIKSYVSQASEKMVTDVLDEKMPRVRADQLRMLAEDIEADIQTGENVALRDLTATLADKVRRDDPKWLVLYSTTLGKYLQDQIQIGVGVGNLSYDQLVRLKDVTDSMHAVSVLHTPENPNTEAEWQRTLKSLEEVDKQEAEIAKEALQRG